MCRSRDLKNAQDVRFSTTCQRLKTFADLAGPGLPSEGKAESLLTSSVTF
jgi:hypothetical protein